MELSKGAKKAISMLEEAGFEAFAVGGCVRDFLLGKTPTDFDITTSAKPEETKAVFKNEHVIETGIKHGTVTVLMEGEPLEITTFRIDKNYSDNRRPEEVEFTKNLREDLSRRDFTVNALAFNEKTGVIDLFGGVFDLEHGIIRAVGNPEKRFNEDALRIMRALRFASVLGFKIEEKPAAAISENAALLKKISAERVFSELLKLLCGNSAAKIIFEHPAPFFEVIPELSVLKGFDQHHFRHNLDAFEHSLTVLENVPPGKNLRLAALFHDIAKPLYQSFDESGTAHYYGHAQKSAEIAEAVLKRLKADSETIKTVSELIRHHEDRFEPTKKAVKRLLGKTSPEFFENLLCLMEADEAGKAAEFRLDKSVFSEFRRLAAEIIEKKECFSLKNLAINGADLISAGFEPGPEMGKILETLLEKVIEGEIQNEKEALLSFAKGTVL